MLEMIQSFSPSVLLGVILLTIVVLMRLKVSIALAFAGGALLAAVFFPMEWDAFARVWIEGKALERTFFLALMVLALTVFSTALAQTDQTTRIIDSFRGIVGHSRLSIVAFPALIGLLPMPGGAVFSAPMVEAAVRDFSVSRERAAAANYWFRHIWEYWFPLYPGVIYCLTLSNVSTGVFIFAQGPMTLFSLVLGYWFVLRSVRLGPRGQRNMSRQSITAFLVELTPLILLVGIVTVAEGVRALGWWPEGGMWIQRGPLLLSVAAAFIWLAARRGLTGSMLVSILRQRRIHSMVWMVFGLMLFNSTMEACGAIDRFRLEMEAWQLPVGWVIGALPFVAGLILAVAFGMVGASFPFIIPLVETMPAAERPYWYAWAYSMGYVGMMLSPAHVCLTLTIEHFQARWTGVYRYLVPICLGIILSASGLFLFHLWRIGAFAP